MTSPTPNVPRRWWALSALGLGGRGAGVGGGPASGPERAGGAGTGGAGGAGSAGGARGGSAAELIASADAAFTHGMSLPLFVCGAVALTAALPAALLAAWVLPAGRPRGRHGGSGRPGRRGR